LEFWILSKVAEKWSIPEDGNYKQRINIELRNCFVGCAVLSFVGRFDRYFQTINKLLLLGLPSLCRGFRTNAIPERKITANE
jgi:hypothetical protein